MLTILKGLVQGISNTIGVQLLSGTFGPVNLALTDPNLGIGDLVTHEFALDDYETAFDLAANGHNEAMKVAFRF